MPLPALRAMARKLGASPATAESIWNQQKAQIKPQPGKDRGKHSYRYLMATVKHILQNRRKAKA